MNIGIDGNTWIYEKGGIGRYTKCIIKALLDYDKKNKYIIFFNLYKNFSLKKKEIEKELEAYSNVSVKFIRCPGKIRDLLFDFGFPSPWFFRERLDIFFAPYFSGISENGYPKQVVTIHDLSFLLFEGLASESQIDYWKLSNQRAIKKSNGIIAVSDSTHKDICRLIPESKNATIKRIYPGLDKKVFPSIDNIKSSEKSCYILSVCSLEPRKNIISLVNAYNLLPKDQQAEYKLVLVGEPRWKTDDLIKLAAKNPNIRFTGFICDKELSELYKGAAMFVYPSLYEGFGFPVLEAMAFGLPVLVGKHSSLVEVASQVGVYIDINNPENIAEKIKKVIGHSPQEKERLKSASLAQSQKYSWHNCARETLDFFESING